MSVGRNRLALGCTLGVFLLAAATSASPPEESCRNVHVLTCDGQVDFYDLDQWSADVGGVSLTTGPWSAHEPSSITFSTHPKSRHNTSFVTQGPYVHVIENHTPGPWRSLPLGEVAGASIVLNGIAVAEEPVLDPGSGQSTYWALIVGNRDTGPSNEPYFFIVNQVDLIATDAEHFPIIAEGSFCDGGQSCSGTATSVSARNTGADSVEFHVSIVDPQTGTNNPQRIVRVDVDGSGSFTATTVVTDDAPFAGNVHRNHGIDYDLDGNHYATFQTDAELVDISTGATSCPLAGDPTDLATWGPQSNGTLLGTYHFVTLDNGGNDTLVGVPAGECPDTSPGAISLPLGNDARAVAISSRDYNRFWMFAGSRSGTLHRYDFVLALGADGHYPIAMTNESRSSACVVDIAIEANPTMDCGPGTDPDDDCEIDPELNPHCGGAPDDTVGPRGGPGSCTGTGCTIGK